MKRNDGLTGFWCMVSTTLLVVLASLHPVSQAQDTSRNGQPADNGQEILTRGPIHEAFGQPTVFNPKPGLLIPKKPPQPVEELPPDEKPEGDNVAWLGGYWSWDEDKNDFLWVSGFWRVLPPGRQWIPGYWNENAGQYQWVSGYWANAELEEEQVIQQPPPESLEQGAPPTAPSQEHIWAPGTWVYRESRYMWRPGYWIVAQPGWSWIPASYVWTPGGYIFVDGYWDWSIRRRGILFAPCYFDYNVIYRPGFVYRPAVCLDIDIITPHFFCRPAYSHYYFGDYYATSYLSVGITPWFNFTYARGPRFYSSDFVYYENHFRRTNPNWARDVRLGYERHRDNVHLRPARTFVSQQTVINNITINNINNNNTRIVNNNTNVNNLALAKPIKTYTAKLNENPDAPIKVERINENRVREFGRNAAEVRKIAGERVTMERQLATPGKTGSTAGTETAIRRVTLPKSPIVSKMPINNGETDDKNPNVGSIGKTVSRTPPPVPGQNRDLKQITRGSSPVTARPGSGKNADPGNSGNGTTAAGNTAGNKTGGTAGNPGGRMTPGKGGQPTDDKAERSADKTDPAKTDPATTGPLIGGAGSRGRNPGKLDPGKEAGAGNKTGPITGGRTGSKPEQSTGGDNTSSKTDPASDDASKGFSGSTNDRMRPGIGRERPSTGPGSSNPGAGSKVGSGNTGGTPPAGGRPSTGPGSGNPGVGSKVGSGNTGASKSGSSGRSTGNSSSSSGEKKPNN